RERRQWKEAPRRRRLPDRHLDHHRPWFLEPAPQLLAQLGWGGGAQAHGAEALGQAHEIGVDEVTGNQPAAVKVLLHAPHIAEGVVVEDDADHAHAELYG